MRSGLLSIRSHGTAASIDNHVSEVWTPGAQTMPVNACIAFYDCNSCGATLKPLPGSCCVFCSYGSVPCPPIQQGVEPCCTPLPDPRSKDWVGSKGASLLAWWLPSAAIIASLFASVPTRTIVWTVALALMGIACILNTRQCGRTHCRNRPLLLGHDCSGSSGWVGRRPAHPLWLDRARHSHSRWRLCHLVGHGTRVGQIHRT